MRACIIFQKLRAYIKGKGGKANIVCLINKSEWNAGCVGPSLAYDCRAYIHITQHKSLSLLLIRRGWLQSTGSHASLFIAKSEVRVYTAPDERQFVIFSSVLRGVVQYVLISINMCWDRKLCSRIYQKQHFDLFYFISTPYCRKLLILHAIWKIYNI